MRRALAIDLCTGLHGWAEGLVAEGYRVIGFDLEDMCAQFGQPRPPNVQLVLQDVLTLHGSQFKDATLIVASPPCTFFSYCAMPWSRAKALAAEVRADPLRLEKELALFRACFRIQREACEAAGHHIPLIVENVRGAIPWVGRSRWNFGSFHLWGDVPALMPPIAARPKVAGFRFDGSGRSFQSASCALIPHIRDGAPHTRHLTNPAEHIKCGGDWFNAEKPSISRLTSSGSPARKAASAMIAKIPFPLSSHIARVFLVPPARIAA